MLLNAVDADAFRRSADWREAVRRDLGLPSETLVIGLVGRLEREKRYDLLIEAAAPIMRARADVRLAIAGEGSLRQALAGKAAALGVADRVLWLGHREDIVDVHHVLDVFVQSSETEGTPNAVLEAMAMETPIVATDVGGTRELAAPDVHALLVPRHDTAALARAIAAVVADPAAARRRAASARERVEHDLSFDARTDWLGRIYRELVDQRDAAASSVPAHA